jgi:hypothetical protein
MEKVVQAFKVFDNFIEIKTIDPIKDNSVYEIRIKGLKALNKSKKLDSINLKVITALTPSYCSIEGINSLVEVFGIPEEKLLYYIREASRYADYVMKGTAVKDGIDPTFEVEQFVKTKASLDALIKAYVEKAAESGSKGTLGDITFENSDSFAGIKDLIKTLKEELKKWEDAMRGYYNEGRAKPKATKIGMKASSNSDVAATTVDTILNDFTRTRAQEG